MDFNKIKVVLRDQGLSVNELCKHIGITGPGFHKMIRNNNATVANLEKISEFLNVSPAYWFDNRVKNNSLDRFLEKKMDYYVSKEVYEKLANEYESERRHLREQTQFLQDQIIILNRIILEKL